MVLNDDLYNALVSAFGKVKVANSGCRASRETVFKGRRSVARPKGGEYYRVSCPKCFDTRFRLWISYLWGTADEDGEPQTDLCHCFNEGCEGKRGSGRLDLFDYIYGAASHIRPRADLQVLESSESSGEATLLSPGYCLPLSALPRNHRANVFFERRRFDPSYMEKTFGVMFCETAYERLKPGLRYMLKNRIIFPISAGGKVVGWQARYVDENGCGVPPDKSVPKYYTSPGFHKSWYLYNYDRALKENSSFGLLVEGVMDVARIPWSLGSFGAHLSMNQVELLYRIYRHKSVVILWDRDVSEKAKLHRDRLYSSFLNGVVAAILPDDRDPADWDQEELLQFIGDSAHRQGVDLASFPVSA